jgi:signal transduction histidine kinase
VGGTCQTLLQAVAVRVGRNTLDQLLVESGIALGIMAVGSVGLGWLMAGRVLSPLRTITAAARRISARSLHQRIAMTGPDDELKELGDTFDQLLGRLDASFRAQRQFVANASHELRTPLARQRTLLEVALRDREATNASLRAACERALAAGEQQERLIAGLLTLARGERGLDQFEPFDLAAIAVDALAGRQDAAQLTVTARIEPAEGAGDPGLAERLVANLVDNAIRYNAAGGRVEIGTGTRAGRPYLTVANTGPVIPPDQLGRLFQPFQRMDPARRAPGGLGLGLAIVSAIAAAHGADLRAITRTEGGLTIEVLFPPGRGLRADGVVVHRPRSTGPCVPGPKRPRFTGVRLPPTLTAGADVTADTACPGAPLIVDRYLANKEVTIHGNPEAGPGARIAAFAGLRAVLGSDRLTACPAQFHRMAMAELGRLSVASMVSQRAGWALAQLARPALRGRGHTRPKRDAAQGRQLSWWAGRGSGGFDADGVEAGGVLLV